MTKTFRFAVAALAVAALAGCATYQEERDTTQPGKLKKAAFADGPWYTLSTVVDAPYEASFAFIGSAGNMEKIQWDIQEDFLVAYRSYEYITGSDAPRKDRDGDRFRGEPVAVYKIQSHFDLWHQYNPVTGEEIPVLYEAQERPWYEREYMRVDWSAPVAGGWDFQGADFCALAGLIQWESMTYAPSKPGDPEAVYFAQRTGPDQWQNHYDLTSTQNLDTIDYIDVVSRRSAAINIDALFGDLTFGDAAECFGYPTMPLAGALQITFRRSFMKVDSHRFEQYEPMYYPDPAFEKFGYFRDEQYTYDARRGTTDFLGYRMHRWNIWQESKNADGSTIPMSEREIRPIVYYINREAPEAYRNIAHKYIAKESWNRAFAGAVKAVGHPAMAGKDPHTTPAEELPQIYVLKDAEYNCGLDGQQACQRLGDLRYSFMHFVDRPSLGSPLGYGPSFSDPETGEIINAVANFYGPALESLGGFIGDLYDLVKGNVSEDDIMTGEAARQYFQNQGANVLPPTFPQVNLEMNVNREALESPEALEQHLAHVMPRAAEMKPVLEQMRRDPSAAMSPYSMEGIAGTPLERLLVSADNRAAVFGVLPAGADPAELSEEMLEKISPFRNNGMAHLYERLQDKWARGGIAGVPGQAAKRGCMLSADFFMDLSMEKTIALAEERIAEVGLDDEPNTGDEREATREDVIQWILLHTFRGVEEHEVGHTLGLRHNFEGTYDEENYHPEYWEIANANPEPTVADFDTDGDNQLNYEEWTAYNTARIDVKRTREAAGVDLYTYSTIMDYSMHFYYNDIIGIGKYDHAAIKFGYAGQIDVYEDPNNKGTLKENRSSVPYFLGGERCETSAECPMSGETFTVNGRQYAQHCRLAVSHAGGVAQIGAGVAVDDQATADSFGNRTGVCSNVYTELKLGEYAGWTAGMPIAPVATPNFRFCSDERVGDRPFCSRYDEGKTAVEVVENQIEEYERAYIFNNFRRYRLSFEPYFYVNRIFGRYFVPIGKIYQSMLYQLYYTPGFYQDPEKGFVDFLQASIMGLNFFGKVLATPDVGAYTNWQDPGQPNLLESDWRYGENHDPDADFYLPLGAGKHLWTELETGYYGAIQRYARMGTFYDKLFALEALATRDWGFPQANDETYPINFYDGFKPELLEMFGGMAKDDAFAYGPAVRVPDRSSNIVNDVQYRQHWTGQFFDSDLQDWGLAFAGPANFTPFPGADPAGTYEVMDPGGSFIIRLYSIIYSLGYFSVFYDNTFPGYMQLSVFNDVDPRNADGLTQPDVISHYSPKYRKLYAATQTADDRSFTHGMVSKARALSDKLEMYRSHPNPSDLMDHPACEYADDGEDCRDDLIRRTENEIESVETMLNFTNDILRSMGVVF